MNDPDGEPGERDFRPRPHDHLVEPMFAGLGVDAGDEGRGNQPAESSDDTERPRPRRLLWARLLRWFGLQSSRSDR